MILWKAVPSNSKWVFRHVKRVTSVLFFWIFGKYCSALAFECNIALLLVRMQFWPSQQFWRKKKTFYFPFNYSFPWPQSSQPLISTPVTLLKDLDIVTFTLIVRLLMALRILEQYHRHSEVHRSKDIIKSFRQIEIYDRCPPNLPKLLKLLTFVMLNSYNR